MPTSRQLHGFFGAGDGLAAAADDALGRTTSFARGVSVGSASGDRPPFARGVSCNSAASVTRCPFVRGLSGGSLAEEAAAPPRPSSARAPRPTSAAQRRPPSATPRRGIGARDAAARVPSSGGGPAPTPQPPQSKAKAATRPQYGRRASAADDPAPPEPAKRVYELVRQVSLETGEEAAPSAQLNFEPELVWEYVCGPTLDDACREVEKGASWLEGGEVTRCDLGPSLPLGALQAPASEDPERACAGGARRLPKHEEVRIRITDAEPDVAATGPPRRHISGLSTGVAPHLDAEGRDAALRRACSSKGSASAPGGQRSRPLSARSGGRGGRTPPWQARSRPSSARARPDGRPASAGPWRPSSAAPAAPGGSRRTSLVEAAAAAATAAAAAAASTAPPSQVACQPQIVEVSLRWWDASVDLNAKRQILDRSGDVCGLIHEVSRPRVTPSFPTSPAATRCPSTAMVALGSGGSAASWRVGPPPPRVRRVQPVLSEVAA